MLKNGKLKLSIFVLLAFVLSVVFSAQASKTGREIDQLTFKPLVQPKGEVAGVFTTTLVSLVINNGQTTKELGLELTQPATVLSLLEKAQKNQDLSFAVKKYDFGTLLEELNGIKNGDNGKNWMYYVNDKAATVGVESLMVKGGDKVEFRFEKF